MSCVPGLVGVSRRRIRDGMTEHEYDSPFAHMNPGDGYHGLAKYLNFIAGYPDDDTAGAPGSPTNHDGSGD